MNSFDISLKNVEDMEACMPTRHSTSNPVRLYRGKTWDVSLTQVVMERITNERNRLRNSTSGDFTSYPHKFTLKNRYVKLAVIIIAN